MYMLYTVYTQNVLVHTSCIRELESPAVPWYRHQYHVTMSRIRSRPFYEVLVPEFQVYAMYMYMLYTVYI
jgi:hypothetical protein